MPTATAVGSDVAVLRDFDSTVKTPVLTAAFAPTPANVRPLTVASSSSAEMATTPKDRPMVSPSATDVLSALILTVPPAAVMLPPSPTNASVSRLTSVDAKTTVTPTSPMAAPLTEAFAVFTEVARMSTLVAVIVEPPVAYAWVLPPMSERALTAATPTLPPATATVTGATFTVDVPVILIESPAAVSVDASM